MRDGRLELLAPAGSMEALRAALAAGADAVYIGGSRFGARAYADNPGEEELCEAIRFTHRVGAQLYLTVNTLLKDQELEEDLIDYIRPYVETGLDGVIVQDLGVAALLREVFPSLPLHASTQMAVTGPKGAAFLQEQGLVRVVPARELSLAEICAIHEETGLEIEAFVHGAMCYSYSGQCLMSSLIGGRSGNRGRCAGVCRLPFTVTNEQGRVLSGKNRQYPLNMKDMCALDLLPQMAAAGVTSFKIEGRMKKPAYTAGVVSVYRKYLDRLLADPVRFVENPGAFCAEAADRQKLWDLFNRDGFCTGCYEQRNGRALIALKNEKLSDVRQMAAQKQTEAVRAWLGSHEAQKNLQRPLVGTAVLREGRPALLAVSWTQQTPDGPSALMVKVTGAVVQAAEKQPLAEARVRTQLEKTGGSDFYFSALHIQMDPSVFLPMQAINALRRAAFEKAARAIDDAYRRDVGAGAGPDRAALFGAATAPFAHREEAAGKRAQARPVPLFAAAQTEAQLSVLAAEPALAGLYVDSALFEKPRVKALLSAYAGGGAAVRLQLPYVLRRNEEQAVAEGIAAYQSWCIKTGCAPCILVRNLEEAGLLRETGALPYAIADAGLYTMNRRAAGFLKAAGLARWTMPLELNAKEMGRRADTSTELILYGRAPMMISAHCVQKTMDRCTRADARLTLSDRKGAQFPVQCVCSGCYNVIYNSLPTSLLAEQEAVRRLPAAAYRLQFSVEDERQTLEVVRAFARAYAAGGAAEPLSFETTKGHFRRGVE